MVLGEELDRKITGRLDSVSCVVGYMIMTDRSASRGPLLELRVSCMNGYRYDERRASEDTHVIVVDSITSLATKCRVPRTPDSNSVCPAGPFVTQRPCAVGDTCGRRHLGMCKLVSRHMLVPHRFHANDEASFKTSLSIAL